MQTLQRFKKLGLLIVMLIISGYLSAQTPQYYNFNNGTSGNNFPFGMSTGKGVNYLFLAGELNQPTPVPAGQKITTVYFRTGGTGTRTFTNLHILMAQDVITTLTTGAFYPGPYDTVFVKDTTLASTAGGWMAVTLNRTYNYDPTKSLIIFVGQCGFTGTATSVYNSPLTGIRRTWSVGGCPFTPYTTGGGADMLNFGVDVVPAAPTFSLPDVLYYKFRLNPSATTVTNFATSPPSGTNTATVTGLALGSGGQFDSCLVGTSLTGTGATHKLNTNWTTNIGTSSWTIGMWLNLANNTPGTNACYLFGDPGASSFRCFWAGAGINIGVDTAILLRFTGMPDMRLPVTSLTNVYVHFVYDSATSTMKSYKNGVFANQVTWTGINLTGAGPFTVAGYSTSTASMITGMKMDEFRFYKRALGQAEITATWNQNLGVITAVTPIVSNVPDKYSLSQNYPNPFNPTTKINFAIPKSGLVSLRIYDILGREIKTLVNEVKAAGTYSVDFNASTLSSGMYFYRLESNDFVDTKKMMLVK